MMENGEIAVIRIVLMDVQSVHKAIERVRSARRDTMDHLSVLSVLLDVNLETVMAVAEHA